MRAQHRFGGMRDESKNDDGIRNEGTFNGGMRDKNISVRTGFALFEKWYSK